MNKAPAVIAVGVAFAVAALAIAALAYSYTQVSVSLDGVEFHSIEWDVSVSNLFAASSGALTGNYLSSVLALIEGINLNLTFELGNGGLLPVYVPNVAYDLAVNGVPVGQAASPMSTTINPGQVERIITMQNVKKDT